MGFTSRTYGSNIIYTNSQTHSYCKPHLNEIIIKMDGVHTYVFGLALLRWSRRVLGSLLREQLWRHGACGARWHRWLLHNRGRDVWLGWLSSRCCRCSA